MIISGALVANLAACNALSRTEQTPAAQRWTPEAIASDQYETTPTFTPDGEEMHFFRGDPAFRTFQLHWSKCENGKWSAAMRPPFASTDSKVIEADPGITPDGRRLYYISTRHAPGSDDFDIWYVDRAGNGWGEPHRMPEPVNSPAPELLPRADKYGNLYFGSAREGGYGGGDIYVAREREGKWEVANAGSPVSSPAYEYEAEISSNGEMMIVVADRGDKSHLYRFDKTATGWIEHGRIPTKPDVFQVGPLLSPDATRLLFAQADGARSGEMFVLDLQAGTRGIWPRSCESD
jgi:WD40-like Beta Propeller Repeat